MKVICHSRGKAPIYLETDEGDWPHWRYDGEWQNLMGMSWEYMSPPKDLEQDFAEIVEWYS